MTAVGPPDWPITALPETRSGTEHPIRCDGRENAQRLMCWQLLRGCRPMTVPVLAHILCHEAARPERALACTINGRPPMSPRMDRPKSAWPELPYAAWKDTYATLHLWTQMVGKIRLAQTPWLNHSWHVVLYVSPRGLTTS